MTNDKPITVRQVDKPSPPMVQRRPDKSSLRKETSKSVGDLARSNQRLYELEAKAFELGDAELCCDIGCAIKRNHQAIFDLLVPLILLEDIPKMLSIAGKNVAIMPKADQDYIAQAVALELSLVWGKRETTDKDSLKSAYIKKLARPVVQEMDGGRRDRGYYSHTVPLDDDTKF